MSRHLSENGASMAQSGPDENVFEDEQAGFRKGLGPRQLQMIAIGGAIGTVPLVWSLADTFAATMVLINLCAIVPLGGVAIKLLRDFSQQKAAGKDPIFHRDSLPELKNVECWDGTDPECQRREAPTGATN